jgi:hypothetical protein
MKIIERTAAVGAIGILLLASASFRVTAFVSRDAQAVGGAEEARAVWEEAIRAKGGRARLHAIRTFAMSSYEEFAHSPRPDVITHEFIEQLYAPPSRFWEYDDYRPGKMGDGGLALDTNQHRVFTAPDRGPAQGLYEDLVYRLRNGQFLYLMETAYVQPEPIGLKRGRLDRRDVDIIETRVDDDSVEFSLDRKSHLPARIVIMERRLRFPRVWRLSDYHAVDGVEMPSNVDLGEDKTNNMTTYRFNVEYDEAVFHRATVRFEKNAWMKAKP